MTKALGVSRARFLIMNQVEQERYSIMKQLITQGFIPEIAATFAGVSLNEEELQTLQEEYIEYITGHVKEKNSYNNSKKS